MKGTVPKRLDICYYFGTFYTILNFYFLILDFNAPVNKIPEGTAERHLRHHVNLNNYDNKYEPKKSSAVTCAHTVSLFLSVRPLVSFQVLLFCRLLITNFLKTGLLT